MQKVLEGSQAIAEAVALCRPQVIAAYPITPQTHIVENLSRLVANAQLKCEFVSVESEFSAASVILGAAMAGSRSYTASASQGILLMAEVLYNIAGMRVPLVLTCANRAISAPLSIWNDQQDSMAVRDAGWIQLYCANNQEAVDTTIQAYRIAEACELPVMVCVDGFTLTHTLEMIDIPEARQVDAFLPDFQFSRQLDVQHPHSAGTLLSPDYYSEARHAHHQALLNAQQVILESDTAWEKIVGRSAGKLVSIVGNPDADIAIIALGSVLGTLEEAQEIYTHLPSRLIKLRCFRPFPTATICAAIENAKHVIVLERALSLGSGGILGTEVRSILHTLDNPPIIHNFAIGLGGRDIPVEIYPQLIEACKDTHPPYFQIFDVDLQKLPEEDR